MKTRLLLVAGLLLPLCLACGKDSQPKEIACGEGTELREGVCVATAAPPNSPATAQIKAIRRNLTDIVAILEAAKEGGRYTVGNDELSASLVRLPALAVPDNLEQQFTELALQSKGRLLVELLGFYNDVARLNSMMKDFLRFAKLQSRALRAGDASLRQFNPMQFGGLLQLPNEADADAGKPTVFRMVQLGAPVCQGQKRPSPQGCLENPIAGFGYREDMTAAWRVAKLAPTKSPVPSDHLVMLDPSTKVLAQIIKGGEATAGEFLYLAKLHDIDELCVQMLDNGKRLQVSFSEAR